MITALHVVPDLAPGGAALGVCELVRRLARAHGVNASLCVLGTPVPTASVSSGIAVRYLCAPPPLSGPAALARCVAGLRTVIGEVAPGIVHSHLLPADLASALAVIGSGAVHVAHVRDTRPWLVSRRPASVLKRLLLRTAIRLADTRFLAVSSDAAAHAMTHLGIAPSRMRVVLNGIDTTRLAAIERPRAPSGTIVLGAAGRLVAEKGHDILIRAAGLLVRRGFDLRVEIAGSGSRLQPLIEIARREGLESRVTFHGQIGDMAAFYAGLDVFVLPSIESEGLSRALLEAMASGVPVVSTRSEGVGDVVLHRVNGLLVERSNPSDMAGAIGELIENRQLTEQLARAGRREVLDRFHADRVALDVRDIYRELLSPMLERQAPVTGSVS
jgi:glycosyltransferase involved in cell wall biosynthesis